jgi:hypothetical protein
MRHVALGAFTLVVFVDDNLFVPCRAGWIGLMAADALREGGFVELRIGISGMRICRPMAAFTGKSLMLVLGELQDDIRMAFVARLFAREADWAVGHLSQGRAAIPSIIAERMRRQKSAGDEVRAHDPDG